MISVILASGGLLSIDIGLFVWILVTFLLFIGIFAKLAWGPILNAIKERESNIRESLQAAEVALKRAEQVSKDNEAALRAAEAEAQKIRREALDDAEKAREAMKVKAKDEADKLISEAKSAIEKEKKQALLELQGEVADLALRATKIILDAELDEAKNKKLVENFINDLSKN
ncbi:ATP synthase F0 subunit B [bacterium]|nr:MAG: ATP synthase F0 subunit B [bacterium]